MKTRTVRSFLRSRPTVEGAGVQLRRALGPHETHLADPFLLLDDFQSKNPSDYIAGFPWHPHRGIETVTYMIRGTIEHGDSMGNSGVIDSGDVQWMTAGSGILHQEMPRAYAGDMQGFQLWVNLPASKKMTEPRYRGITADMIPTYPVSKGADVRIIAGSLEGMRGPVRDLGVEIEYLDVSLQGKQEFVHDTKFDHTFVAYVFEGHARFSPEEKSRVTQGHAVFFDQGDQLKVIAGEAGARFLLISGRPLAEPIAWGGPIVMNSQDELDQAFTELRNGSFIKSEKRSSPSKLDSLPDIYRP